MKRIAHNFILVSLFSFFAFPVIAAISPGASLEELIFGVTEDTAAAVQDQLTDQDNFKQTFDAYHTVTAAQLQPTLDQLAQIIRDYAENEQGLKVSSDELFLAMSAFTQNVNGTIQTYPRLEEVIAIIQPVLDDYMSDVAHEFPDWSIPKSQSSPLAHVAEFFQAAEQQNPFGLGSFFKLEPLLTSERARILAEQLLDKTQEGFRTVDILSREESIVENGDVVFYQQIIDNEIISEFQAPEDLSIIHGLPQQLAQDGVDTRVVRFVEESIHLLNYHLLIAHNQEGLIIDASNPQLVIPAGYTPDEFVANFIEILLEFLV